MVASYTGGSVESFDGSEPQRRQVREVREVNMGAWRMFSGQMFVVAMWSGGECFCLCAWEIVIACARAPCVATLIPFDSNRIIHLVPTKLRSAQGSTDD
jgi:hypothetical protein